MAESLTLQAIVDLVMNNGLAVILVGYFIFKDYKFNQQIIAVLDKINVVLTVLQTYHRIESGEEEA